MALDRKNFTTPPGRLVQGNLYKPNTTDAEGRPLLTKNGPNTGQPRVEYFIALAIPKGQEPHWAHTQWGGLIWQAGHAFLQHAGNLQGFAWKVKDGDSQQVDKKGKRPCDREGYPGHWVLHMSGGFQPGLYTLAGGIQQPQQLTQPNAINLGDFVQVNVDVVGNGSPQQPGVYLNPNMVCLLGYGQRIVVGPDVGSAGFGGVALPAGAMATPPAGFQPAAPQTPGATPALPGVPAMPPGMSGPASLGAPALPGGYPQPGAPAAAPNLPPALPGVPAMPSMPAAPAATLPGMPAGAYLLPNGSPGGVPGSVPGAMPPAMPAPAAGVFPQQMPGVGLPPANPQFLQGPPAGPQMTAQAQGSYQQYLAAGWTDATLRQHGLMV